MEYRTVRGTQDEMPKEHEVCGNAVFTRKNIRRVTVDNMDQKVEMWEYEEAKIPTQDFIENFVSTTTELQEQNRADIAYIAMMSDIEL